MKKLILCFDGTCNEAKDADQDRTWFGLGEPEDNSISNILKIHLLLGGDLQRGQKIGDQLSFYYPGVGTYGSWFRKLKNSIKAPPNEDVGKIIKAGMRDLFKNYNPGDKLFIFGFSRGAAIARRFASVLNESYGAMGWKKPPTINFMGVFETVAAIKKPNLVHEEMKPASDVVFENGSISPLIEKALHLLCLDDRRIAFMPTLMSRDPRVTEVWFAGAHSDVGGGYRYDGLSDNALHFMKEFIENDDDLPISFLEPANIDYDDLFEGSDELIKYEDVIVQPNPMGVNHEQSAITKIKEIFLCCRSPRVNVNDKHSIYPPIIHRSVFDRMVVDSTYKPESLIKNLNNPYTGEETGLRVWEPDNTCSDYQDIEAAKKNSAVIARTLEINESASIRISSNVKFNRTGILLGGADQAYSFIIDMKQKWYDASIECGPGGWDRNNDSLGFIQRQFIRMMEGSKRHPEANWFEVIGTIGQNDQNCFKILEHANKKTTFKPTAQGELFVFANDLHSKYGNNRGTIMMTVKRVK